MSGYTDLMFIEVLSCTGIPVEVSSCVGGLFLRRPLVAFALVIFLSQEEKKGSNYF